MRVGSENVTSISRAKASLPKLVEQPYPTVLLKQNKPVAALLPIDDYNDYVSLQKLARHPALLSRLLAAAKKARRAPIAELRKLEDLERRLKSR